MVDDLGLDASTVEVVIGEDAVGGGSRNGEEAVGDHVWKIPIAKNEGLYTVTKDVHDSLSVRLLQAELAAIQAEVELDRLNGLFERETKRRESFEANKVNDRRHHNEDGSSDMTKALQAEQGKIDSMESHKRLLEIEAGIVKCDTTIRRLDVLRGQDKLLSGYVDEAEADSVLKKVSFWQNVINYLLYTVFICNAFITGLGVTGGQGGASWVNGTVTDGQAPPVPVTNN